MPKFPTSSTDPEERYEEDEEVRKASQNIKEWYQDKEEDGIAYTRQLSVLFEKQHYHWITYNAIRYLHDEEGFLKKDQRRWGPNRSVNFYYTDQIKYKDRKKTKLFNAIKLLDENSEEIGNCGEDVVERSFNRIRSMEFIGKETQRYNGKEWGETGEDLDFIFEYDGVGVGVEVKNRLPYPKKSTIQSKAQICEYLGLKPVFVVRFFPWHWKDILTSRDGFFLAFEDLLVPHYLEELQESLDDMDGLSISNDITLPQDDRDRFKEQYLELLG